VRHIRDERAAAPVEFVLVAGFLLTPLFLAIVRLGLSIHVRNTLVACANEGARLAADADATLAVGVNRTRDCIKTSLRASYAEDVSARTVATGGTALIEVTVRAPLPLVSFVGPHGALVARGHAVAESP